MRKKLGKKIKDPDMPLLADKIQVLTETSFVEMNISETATISLSRIVKILKEEHGDRSYRITVIAESPLEGVIYKFGNHGDYWEVHGYTQGYA